MDPVEIRATMDTEIVKIIAWSVTTVLVSQTCVTLVRAFARRKTEKAKGRQLEVKTDLDIVGASQQVIDTLREELGRLSDRVKKLEDREAHQSRRIEALSKENAQLKRKADEQERKIDELQRENKELHAELRRFEDET